MQLNDAEPKSKNRNQWGEMNEGGGNFGGGGGGGGGEFILDFCVL